MTKNQLGYLLNILSLAIILSFASLTVEAAQKDLQAEEPRWFEIEIIVFKPARESGLNAESWDQKVEFSAKQDRIDFVQPYILQGGLPSSSADLTAQDANAEQASELIADPATDSNQLATQPVNTSIIDIESLDEEASLLSGLNPKNEEKPFRLLKEDLLQLHSVVSSLEKHPDYKMLTHLGWRQPVLGSAQAPSIRIAGGRDFSEQYDYQGNRRIQQEPGEPETDFNPLPQASAIQTTDLPQDPANQLVDFGSPSPEMNNGRDIVAAEEEFEDNENLIETITSLPWVPELDGDIKIYLNRYLHIRTNLMLRRPDKEVIDVIDLEKYDPARLSAFSDVQENPLSQQLDQSTGFDSSGESDSSIFDSGAIDNKADASGLSMDGTQLDLESLSTYSVAPQQEKSGHEFSWEIDDDFLQTESQKLYVERLFNYPMKQSSRVRSGELRLFDHPLFSVLIMIRRFEPEKDELPGKEELPENFESPQLSQIKMKME